MKYRGLAVMVTASVVAILAGCGGGSSSGPFNYPETVADGRAMMRQMLKSSSAPSATIGLFAGNRVVWTEAFGEIDKVNHVPATPTTMFAIGSTSKLIAGMAIMKLVDQGKLNLDTPLVDYVPEFTMVSPQFTQVTVRMLVSHTAGFPGGDYRNDVTYGTPELDYDAQAQQTLTTERLKYPPGEMPVYCNQCFGMIDLLVAAVSDEHSYIKFVQDEIFMPLGMTHTRFGDAPFPAGSFAPSYLQNPNIADPQLFTNNYPAGGDYSTPEDMGHVAIMLMNGGRYRGNQVLSEAAVAEMGRDQTADLPFNPVPSETFGLGWDDVSYPGLAAVGFKGWDKPGGTVGYVTQFIVAPDARLAVMVTGVSFGFNSYLIAEHVVYHALVESGRIPAMPKPLPNVPPPEQTPSDAQLAQIVGDYADFSGLYQVEAASDRTLTIAYYSGGVWNQRAIKLKFRIDGTFSSDPAPDVSPNVSYRALYAGGRGYLVMRNPQVTGNYLVQSIIGQRVEPAAPISAAWKNRVGKYWLIVNEDPQSVHLVRDNLCFTLYAVDSLAGYVFAKSTMIPSSIVDPSVSDTVAQMFLQIPSIHGRDLNDVVIESHSGEEWVRYGSTLYRPQATTPILPIGGSTVTIGSEGYAEWRQVPVAGSVTLTGARAWKLYKPELTTPPIDSGTGDGTAVVPTANSYLLLFGAPTTTINVSVAAQ